MTRLRFVVICVSITLFAADSTAQTAFVGMGDSIGEGVQSADANYATQPYSFLNLIAWRMSAPFPLPYIASGLFGSVSSLDGRRRVDPTVHGLNLAVSGADVGSLLRDRADAVSAAEIDTETDLVLFPRLGSQIEIAEALRPQVVACWIGNNDALGAILAYDHLDGSQLTPIAQFETDFTEIVTRLQAVGTKAVFGTIPDLTRIAYLIDRDDLIRLLGTDHGLPAGSWTTVTTLLGLRFGTVGPTVLQDPNYVLDSSEAAVISDRIRAFNTIIRTVAPAHGMAVADTAWIFDALAANPPVIAGRTITTRYLGGLFSLDGVHPSNFGHAIAAYVFIDALNSRYSLNIPQLDGTALGSLFQNDPFIDKDGDGRVAGRFGFGLLETLTALIGISGDSNDASMESN